MVNNKLLSVCVLLTLISGIMANDSVPQGVVEGHVKISSLSEVNLADDAKEASAAAELAEQADILLEPLDAAERRQLIDLLTRIADHWQNRTAGSAGGGKARQAQALQALQNLAGTTDR